MKRYYENKYKLSNERNLYYEKNRDVLLAKSKLIQKSRNYDRGIDKEQIKELNEKSKDSTQAIKMMKTPNS